MKNKQLRLWVLIGLVLAGYFLIKNTCSAAGWLNVADPIGAVTGRSAKFNDLNSIASFIIDLLFTVGAVTFFIMMGIAGSIYLFGAGNEEQTSKSKRLILDACIGLALLYGSFAIANFALTLYIGKGVDFKQLLIPFENGDSGSTGGGTGGSSSGAPTSGGGTSSGDSDGDIINPFGGGKTAEDCYPLFGYDASSQSCKGACFEDINCVYWSQKNDCETACDIWNPDTHTCVHSFLGCQSASGDNSPPTSGGSDNNSNSGGDILPVVPNVDITDCLSQGLLGDPAFGGCYAP